jgi:hypothetical protein
MSTITLMESKSPAVTCRSCARSWNSTSMAEGLRLLGSCPRCGGELDFAETQPTDAGHASQPGEATVAPHLVLGIPRR